MDNGWNGFSTSIKQEQIQIQTPYSKSDRALYCESCGSRDFEGDDDGFFYCTTCGSQSQDVIHTATAAEDFQANGGIYSFHRTRYQSQNSQPKPNVDDLIYQFNKINQPSGLNKTANIDIKFDDDNDDEPMDFGSGEVCKDEEKLADGIRMRYVEGLQVMLQRQCEVLVEEFGASAYIIGIVGTIWLRYVTSVGVLKDEWPEMVLEESEILAGAKGLVRVCQKIEEEAELQEDIKEVKEEEDGVATKKKPRKSKRIKIMKKFEPRNSYGQRSVYIWLRSLRKMLPLYSTLAISFLVCHISRESILPNDICKWASEGKLPYLTEFKDMDRRLGNPSSVCPFNSAIMFRPNVVLKVHHLEPIAASIAQRIGLRLPSVNFYAIAQRYLKELCLPVEKILPHACRIYEWALPADLWLSSNITGFPSRASVMSMLIVAIRLLYNLQDHGIWERNDGDDVIGDHRGRSSEPCNRFLEIQSSDYNSEELMSILEASYDKIDSTPDYLKDLASYLEYCKEIVYAGKTRSYEVERLMERLWNMYEKQEDEGTEVAMKSSDNVTQNHSMDSTEQTKATEENCLNELSIAPKSYSSSGVSVIEKMKLEMEKNGFHYLPPRNLQKNLYIHYRRHRVKGKLEYVSHLDYYILLRACAKLVEIDPQMLHRCVLRFERRLDWIDKQVDEFCLDGV